jgi:hypothetical protein
MASRLDSSCKPTLDVLLFMVVKNTKISNPRGQTGYLVKEDFKALPLPQALHG